MRIKIVIVEDSDNHVRLDCNPPIQNLVKAWKEGDKNPALAYAILAFQKMMQFSEDIEKEQRKDLEESAMRNSLILPDPRSMKAKQNGPTIVN